MTVSITLCWTVLRCRLVGVLSDKPTRVQRSQT